MTKNQFVAAVATKTSKGKSETAEMVDAIFDVITQTMIKGDSVNISGFGVFRVSDRKAREGINPRTGAKIQIAAKKAPKFRAGKTLKEAVK
ncbi:MAG: HU family DNA-binding protein [bacterium]|nr:HU family DNA-binding protein [bacterium]